MLAAGGSENVVFHRAQLWGSWEACSPCRAGGSLGSRAGGWGRTGLEPHGAHVHHSSPLCREPGGHLGAGNARGHWCSLGGRWAPKHLHSSSLDPALPAPTTPRCPAAARGGSGPGACVPLPWAGLLSAPGARAARAAARVWCAGWRASQGLPAPQRSGASPPAPEAASSLPHPTGFLLLPPQSYGLNYRPPTPKCTR